MQYISNENDIYIYFKLIENLKAKSVLDVGLFLQKIGAVSRQVKGLCIPNEVILEGVESNGSVPLPVYKTLYNEIYSEIPGKKYDLAILIGNDYETSFLKDFLEMTPGKVKAVLLDKETFGLVKSFLPKSYKEISDITCDNDLYYLIKME